MNHSGSFQIRLLLSLALLGTPLLAQKVAMTPPMGWNSWNTFAGNINETVIKATADAMVSTGMQKAGYTYINLDDNWMQNPARDASGNLRADPTRFPDGITGLATYVHSKGLKLGIYTDRGSATCMGVPQSGAYGHEVNDAKTFASWGVDYVKEDNCNTVGQMQSDYTTMSNAIAATGRPMVLSICAWQTQQWMPQIGNLWRSTTDITSSWVAASGASLPWSITYNFDGNLVNFIFTHPGAFADPDMLEVGNGSLSTNENKSHFGLWALMAAPLITGNDLRSMPSSVLSILTQPEVIAIDQDSAGIQGRVVQANGNLEVIAKPLGTDGTTYAIGLFNRGTATSTMTIPWSLLRLDPTSVTVRDVWAQTNLGNFATSYSTQVPSHGLTLLKVVGKLDPSATFWVSDLPFVSVTNGWQFLRVDSSVGGHAPLTVGGKTYSKGLGVNSQATTTMYLGKRYLSFQSDIGVDGEVGTGGTVVFQVVGDGKTLYTSPTCKGGGAPLSINVSVAGVDSLSLVVNDGGDGTTNDHADWAGAKLIPVTTTAIAPPSAPSGSWEAAVRGGSLVLDRPSPDPVEVLVRDLRGDLVLRSRISGSHAEVRLSGVPHGIYLVQLGGSPSGSAKSVLRE